MTEQGHGLALVVDNECPVVEADRHVCQRDILPGMAGQDFEAASQIVAE